MSSYDLRRILAGWDYEPGQITVRKISGDEGVIKIQMRLDLGLFQMEVTGRPDGLRPHGMDSWLDFHESRLKTHHERNGTDLGFELSPEECHVLREEAMQYYHRYLAEFVLEDFEGVERDTSRNLRVLDICRTHAQDEGDRVVLDQYRPYLIMMNTRAQVHLSLREGRFKTALARVKAGVSSIREVLHAEVTEEDVEEPVEESMELAILMKLQQEILARMPTNPLQKLESELDKALEEERYEDATVLRERLEAMRTRKPSHSKKRRR